MLFFSTAGSAHITGKAHQDSTSGSVGDGAAAWKGLKDRFAGNTKEARRVLREQPHSQKMKTGADPTDFIATMDDLRLRLKDMREEISDESYTDLLLHALSPEYQFVKDKSYELGDAFDNELLTPIDTNHYIIQQSRKPLAPPVSGRGAAMAATASDTDQCHQCKAYGHFKRDCPELAKKSRPKRGKKKGKKGGGGEGCSYHKTPNNSDAE